MSNFSSVLIVFHQFFTWITQGDVDLCITLILITKANAIEATWLYHQRNQPIQMPDDVIVMSMSTSLQHKTYAATDHVCKIMLNWKFCVNLKSGVTSHVKVKSCKKEIALNKTCLYM